eukprot:TRINITY_DN875_c0_g1_i1.p1 TRINITY_DN875_c0_g1~~TRINITY_DN875_c0_g1_i1.p1  ORF type:complete len:477 (+),score=117.65 TRINITY_DN875_c0_g1_i1:91-1521(+)
MGLLAPLMLVVAGIIALIFYFDPKRRGSGPGRLPPLYSRLPFFGSMVQFGQNPVAVLKEAHSKLGDCFTIHLTGFNMTYLVGPEAQTAFFKATDEELSQREAYKFVTPVFGPGVVFDSPVSVFYEQMKFIKSGLAANNLKKYVPVIESEAEDFFSKWGDSGEVDMLDNMNKLTILTSSACLLGPEIRRDRKIANDFAELYHDLEGGLNPIAFFFPNFPMPKHWTRDRARKQISELFMRLIKERRSSGEKREDMLQILLESEYKEGGALDDQNITGLLIALLFAGQHTSGITSTWTGFFLLQNPKYMAEVLQEQREIIASDGRAVTFESLRKSVKLENAIREALRMYPPLIILMRKALKPIQYKDITIPAGDFVCVSPAYTMRLPEIYSNPNTYDPTRFDRGEDKQLPYAYVSFGGGRHGCPGENFGITQIKTVWTYLLRNFEFEFGNGMPVPDYANLVVGPTQPCKLRYKRRAVPL